MHDLRRQSPRRSVRRISTRYAGTVGFWLPTTTIPGKIVICHFDSPPSQQHWRQVWYTPESSPHKQGQPQPQPQPQQGCLLHRSILVLAKNPKLGVTKRHIHTYIHKHTHIHKHTQSPQCLLLPSEIPFQ